MRQIGDLLEELGFNREAPLSTQKAFVRHLVKSAEIVRIENSREQKIEQNVTETPTQLSFDPKILGIVAK